MIRHVKRLASPVAAPHARSRRVPSLPTPLSSYPGSPERGSPVPVKWPPIFAPIFDDDMTEHVNTHPFDEHLITALDLITALELPVPLNGGPHTTHTRRRVTRWESVFRESKGRESEGLAVQTSAMLPSFIWRVGKVDAPAAGSPARKGRAGAGASRPPPSPSASGNGQVHRQPQPQPEHQHHQRQQQQSPHRPQPNVGWQSPQHHVQHQVQSTNAAHVAAAAGRATSSHSDGRTAVQIRGDRIKEAILIRCLRSTSGKPNSPKRKLLMEKFSTSRLGDISFVLSGAPHEQAGEVADAIAGAVAEALAVILASDEPCGWALSREGTNYAQSSPYTSQHSSVSADSADEAAAAHSRAASAGNVGRCAHDFAATTRAAVQRTVSADHVKTPKVLQTRVPTAREDPSRSAKTPKTLKASANERPVTTVLLPPVLLARIHPRACSLTAFASALLPAHPRTRILHTRINLLVICLRQNRVTATAKVFEKLGSGGAVPVPAHSYMQTPRVSTRKSPPNVKPRLAGHAGPEFAQQEKQHSDGTAAEVLSPVRMASDGSEDKDSPFTAFYKQVGLTPAGKGTGRSHQDNASSMIQDLKIFSSPGPRSTCNVPALQISGIASRA